MYNEIRGITIGIILVVIGIFKYNGKYFTRKELRNFKRSEVTEENKKLYAQEMGKGIILLGISYSIGYYAYQVWNQTLGTIIICIGFITGLGKMIKVSSNVLKI